MALLAVPLVVPSHLQIAPACLLIHAGTSRSAAVVAAAIMKAKRMTAAAALQLLQVKAPMVAPNDGFLAQLELYEQVA